MKRTIQKILIGLLVLSALLGACQTENTVDEADATSTEIVLTDLMGREVTLDAPARRVVAIGPGALRLYTYAGNLDYVVGVEQMEKNDITGKPYMLANPDLADLPMIGQGGPNNAPDAEKILAVTPDVIFSTYATDASVADELQAKTGIPVVVINYGGFGVTSIFGETIENSLMVIGEAIGDTSQAEAAYGVIAGARDDLQTRTAEIADADKPTVYVGGLGSRGKHGIDSTQGEYALLDVINAINVVDETGTAGSVMIDKEQLLAWDPDFIFIDMGGYASVMEDYGKNTEFYEALSAVQNGTVFAQLPYNYYSTNIDTAIADAYYLGSVVFPEAFADVDPVAKADEVYVALLGEGVYGKMVENFGEFRAIEFE